MISEGGNSGIMYHVIEDSTIPMDYYTGHEFQILDDASFKDKVRDFQLTGSVFGLFPAKNKTMNRVENGTMLASTLIMEK